MADLRLQSGRVQAQSISSLPQPNMNFGQQRRDVEFQAAAESSSVLGRTLSNLSTQMFGMAQSMAESAGEEFVANNPITEKELEAMKNGNTEVFKRKFSLNPFTASVNKFRAHELSSNFELEVVNDAAKIQQQIETGFQSDGKTPYVVDAKKISEDWIAKTNGFGAVLAGYSPDAAYKFRATAAVHGNRVLLAATKATSEQKFLQNQVKIEAEISLHAASLSSIINGYQGNNPAELLSLITAERERVVGNATVLGGLPAQKLALEKTAGIEAEVMKATFENYVFSERTGEIGDTTAFLQRVRDKKLPPKLQNMWDIMSETQRKAVRNGIESEFNSLTKLKDEQKKIDKDKAKVSINENMLIFLSKSSTPEQVVIAEKELRQYSLEYPDLINAQTLMVDLPKLKKEKVEDDPAGRAELLQWIRNNPNAEAPAVLQKARTLNVTAETAFELSKQYLTKDAGERARVEALADIEHDIRTRVIPRGNLTQLKLAFAAKNISFADRPSNFIALLNEDDPKVEKETDQDSFARLKNLVDNNDLKTSVQVFNTARSDKYGYISPSDLRYLYSRVDQVRDKLDAESSSAAQNTANSLSSNNKTRLELADRIKRDNDDRFAGLTAEFKKTGSFTRFDGTVSNSKPLMSDAEAFTNKKYLDEKKAKNIEAQENNIKLNYGPKSPYFQEKQFKLNPKLFDIRPIFLNDKDMTADPSYVKAIIRELKRLGIEPENNLKEEAFTTRQSQLIGENLINDQRQLEKAKRSLGR